MTPPNLDTLTPREREILALIAEGNSLPSIAQQLHRSLKTIESHRLSIGRKLRASNRVELARIAIAQGLVSIKPDAGDENAQAPAAAEQTLQWLGDISEAVCNVNGRGYIKALCNALTRVLGVRFCAVCLSSPGPDADDRYMVAMSEHGRSLETFHYCVSHTPVPRVIEEGAYRIDQGLAERYPGEAFIRDHALQSYFGLHLRGEFGGADAVMTVMHDRPMPNADTVEQVMRFFQARTTAELERVHRMEQLERLRQQLAQHDTDGSPPSPATQPPSGFDALNQLLTHATGVRMLSDLTETLCQMFDMRYCGVCVRDEIDGEPSYLTLAFCEKGLRLDPVHYPIAQTPCEKAAEDGSYCASSNIAERFPNDQWLIDLGVESYVGIRLVGSDGRRLGVMWLVDDKPLTEVERIETTLRYLAPRIGAEVQALMDLEQLREKTELFETNHD
jgi:DNA-binding CsgD family transcriptional regulator